MNTCMYDLLSISVVVCLMLTLSNQEISVLYLRLRVYNSVRYYWLEYTSTLNTIVGWNKYKNSMIKRN